MNGFADNPSVPPSVRVDQPADLPAALRGLSISVGRPVLVVVGGAGGMAPDQVETLTAMMEHALPALERRNGAIVDGGTDSGVMKVMGEARHSAKASLPLVGVAAEGTIILPGKPAAADAAPLEPHHTGVVLVPGDAWGDESPWLSRVATAIADGRPSVTLVINGGQITYDDVDHSLQAGRPVIVLAGTGRTADAIAAAAAGAAAAGDGDGDGDGDGENPRATRIAASPDTRIVSLHDPQALYSAIESILGSPE